MRQNILYSFLFCILVACAVSCKSTENTAGHGLFKHHEMDKNLNDYTYFAAQLSGSLDFNESQQTFNGQLRMKKDSAIWISVTKLGMELARLQITTDSFYLLNRWDRTLLVRPLDYLESIAGVELSLKTLQDIFIGNSLYEKDVPVHVREENDAENRVKKTTLKHLNHSLIATYSQYEFKDEKQRYATNINLFIEGNVKLNLNMKYSKIVIDQPQNMPFSISESVKKI